MAAFRIEYPIAAYISTPHVALLSTFRQMHCTHCACIFC